MQEASKPNKLKGIAQESLIPKPVVSYKTKAVIDTSVMKNNAWSDKKSQHFRRIETYIC